MAEHSVTVHQLKSREGNAWLNVTEDIFGAIAVWGHCGEETTYLLQDKYHFRLIQFTDEEVAAEWMSEYSEQYDRIIKLDSGKDATDEKEQ